MSGVFRGWENGDVVGEVLGGGMRNFLYVLCKTNGRKEFISRWRKVS